MIGRPKIESALEWKDVGYAALVLLLVSVLVALSTYHDDVNADTIVVYLVSLLRWTPFFWGQDRYGMVIPLLASGIHEPLVNVVFQSALHIGTSVASFYLTSRYLFNSRWLEIGTLSVLIFIGLSGTGDIKNFLSPWQVYTPAIAIGMTGLLIQKKRFVLSFVLLALAHWCNFSVTLFLGLLALVKGFSEAQQIGWKTVSLRLRDLGVLLFLSALAGYLIRLPFQTKQSGLYFFAQSRDAFGGWVGMLQDYFTSPRSSNWLLLGPVLMAFFSWLWLRQSRLVKTENNAEIRMFVAGLIAVFLHAVVFGASAFAEKMGYPRRYLIPSLMLWTLFWSGLIFQLNPRFIFHNQIRFATLILLAMILVFRFGVPSVRNVEDAFEARLSATHQEVSAAGCTHLVGNYYRVWESVFYSVLKKKTIWGITGRGEVIQELWDLRMFPSPKVCYWKRDKADALEQMEAFSLPTFAKSTLIGSLVRLEKIED